MHKQTGGQKSGNLPKRIAKKKKGTQVLLVGLWVATVTKENCMEVPLKISTRTIIWISNSTPEHLFKESKNTN